MCLLMRREHLYEARLAFESPGNESLVARLASRQLKSAIPREEKKRLRGTPQPLVGISVAVQIKAIKTHHFGPGSDKVFGKALTGIVVGIGLGHRTQL